MGTLTTFYFFFPQRSHTDWPISIHCPVLRVYNMYMKLDPIFEPIFDAPWPENWSDWKLYLWKCGRLRVARSFQSQYAIFCTFAFVQKFSERTVESCTVEFKNVEFSFSSFSILYYCYFLCLHWEVGFVSFSSLHLGRPALPPLFTVKT